MIAKARHLGARHLAGLQQRRAVLDFDFAPSILIFGIVPEASHSAAMARIAPASVGIGRVVVDARFDHMTKMADEPLHRPRRGIAQRANRMALDLIGYVEQHLDFALFGPALRHALDTRHIHPVPSRQGVHWPQDSCL